MIHNYDFKVALRRDILIASMERWTYNFFKTSCKKTQHHVEACVYKCDVRMLLYLWRALKLTSRSRWDWVWTSLFLTECSCRLDTDSTSKSDSMELRSSGKTWKSGCGHSRQNGNRMYSFTGITIMICSFVAPSSVFTTLITISTKIGVNVYKIKHKQHKVTVLILPKAEVHLTCQLA